MLSQGRDYISTAWWLVTFPGLAIIVTVLGANLFGDALRDALDPRLRGLMRRRDRAALARADAGLRPAVRPAFNGIHTDQESKA
jgi:hypothetical protein